MALKISMPLTGLGYKVIGIWPCREKAILRLKGKTPDILLDMNLKGVLDGTDTTTPIQKHSDNAVICLAAKADEATFSRDER